MFLMDKSNESDAISAEQISSRPSAPPVGHPLNSRALVREHPKDWVSEFPQCVIGQTIFI